jgi:hypothetical protein
MPKRLFGRFHLAKNVPEHFLSIFLERWVKVNLQNAKRHITSLQTAFESSR